jgi:hypothetical protein
MINYNRTGKIIATFMLFIMTFGFVQESMAQAPDPNDFLEEFDNPEDAPIDESVLLLLGAGLIFGLNTLKANKSKMK